jgi:hypothetical protein
MYRSKIARLGLEVVVLSKKIVTTTIEPSTPAEIALVEEALKKLARLPLNRKMYRTKTGRGSARVIGNQSSKEETSTRQEKQPLAIF